MERSRSPSTGPRVPEHADSGAPASSTVAQDALRRLEERLERASGAAERLFSEAAAQATSAALSATRAGAAPRAETSGRAPQAGAAASDGDARRSADPPPQGWTSAESDTPRQSGDLELLITALEAVSELVPPDLRRRLGDAVREVLLAVRALIDWYLERDEGRSSEPPEVQDIPVL